MRQEQVFLDGEGDAWYERNKDKPRLPDPVLQAIPASPRAVIEVGCGDGWRLAEIKRIHRPELCLGFDTSSKAVANKKIDCVYRTAAMAGLSMLALGMHDLIIFGFCLYVVDREDLLSIAASSDQALMNGGHIIIHDFFPEYPYRRAYEHKEGLWSYKMDYSKLWMAHPGYSLHRLDLFGEDDERTGVAVLKKDFREAFPERKI